MSEHETTDKLYEMDRALLDEHGSSYIDTICSIAQGMRAEGRTADADDAMKQCERMRAILLPNRELLAHYAATDCEPGDPVADALRAEIHRRGLDT